MQGETIYDGNFSDGMMHGQGHLLMDTGETWAGQFWKVGDQSQGMQTLSCAFLLHPVCTLRDEGNRLKTKL